MIYRNKIVNIVKSIQKGIITERKTDKISLDLSQQVIRSFIENKPIFIEGIYFERGDEYALFDFKCNFIENENLEEPFSIHAEADTQEIELEITYNPNYFPRSMNDFVAEVKETLEHELEHVEQQNFEDLYVFNDEHSIDYFKYLTSKVEVPAYVRGLIKRAKTKRITLDVAMNEWANENKKMFRHFMHEWPIVKKIWMNYAIEMLKKQKVKKFN